MSLRSLVGEPVSIARTGATLTALIDPRERRLYLESRSDVAIGDTVGFRGYTRRIVEQPQVWFTAGVVATYEDGPPAFPDLGQILRAGNPGTLNEETGVIGDPADATVVWSGPCLVDARESDGSTPDVGDQRVGVVPFIVKVPLAVTDVRPGDNFRVTQSRDGRLLTRLLVVTAVRASSVDLVREVLAFDNQGG